MARNKAANAARVSGVRADAIWAKSFDDLEALLASAPDFAPRLFETLGFFEEFVACSDPRGVIESSVTDAANAASVRFWG